MVKIKTDNLLERLVPVLLFASIALAFVVGILWQKVNTLEGGGKVANTKTAGDTNADKAAPTQEDTAEGKMTEEQAKKIRPVGEDDHVRGSKDAKVYLIEYSDYECPFCARFEPTVKRILDENKDKIAVVYRHFPLDQLHPKARPAAKASECVYELGGNDAFWTFTDAIFGDQTRLENLEEVATDAGVELAAFKSCVDSDRTAKRVDRDYQDGMTAGVRGTPGNFIINDKGEAWFVPGAYPYEQLKPYVDEALKS